MFLGVPARHDTNNVLAAREDTDNLVVALQWRVVEHDGLEREYFVYWPPQVDAATPLPMVLAIHGYTSTATGFAATKYLSSIEVTGRGGMRLADAWADGIEPMSITEGEYDGKPNPHAWMSLSGALIYVDNIRDAFVTHDPENAETYRANAEAYKAELTEAIAPLRDAILAVPEAQRWLVSCEGAFSYLVRDFEMQELYLWPINADQQGTPQQVRKVIDGVRENKIPAVFCESTVSQAPAQQVARETGATYGGMLYVDSLTEEDGPVPTFIDLLRVTSETIVAGLTE